MGKFLWKDVSIPVYNGMHAWPTDPVVELRSFKSLDSGSRSNVLSLMMGSHTGTHVDAPLHIFKDAKAIDEMPLDIFIGRARVIPIKNPISITAAELKHHSIKKGERVLFKTRNSKVSYAQKDFYKNFVYMSLDAADYLVKCKVKLVGIDYLSIGGYQHPDGVKVHQVILGKGIGVVESLNLSKVSMGQYEMICLPLKLMKADGAPARVILRKI